MKCPKCGFVSYPGLAQCGKCGYKFEAAAPPGSSSSILSLFPESRAPTSDSSREEALPPLPRSEAPDFLRPEPPPDHSPSRIPPPTPGPESASPSREERWKEELTERVENYRRRRAQPQPESGADGNLDLDFSEAEGSSATDEHVLEFPREDAGLDIDLGRAATPQGKSPALEGLPLEKRARTSGSGASVGEVSLASAAPERGHVEIVIAQQASASSPAVRDEAALVPVAPLGRRFLAGLADAGVLLVGAILFALIFWRAGGQLSRQPLNLAVLGFIGMFFVFVYFAISVTFAASTPGLLWMGIEVRNLDGLPPTPREALWRAFGYLVSVAALMLGFVWALVDSENLTWHDRMSGTFLVPVGGGIALEDDN